MKIWSLKSENAAKTFHLRFSLNLLVTLMVSYHLNFHDVTLAGLPVLLILHRLESSKITPGSRYAGIFGAVLALALVPLYAMGRQHFHLLFWVLLVLALCVSSEIGKPEKKQAEPGGASGNLGRVSWIQISECCLNSGAR